jgi:hypothetical protein
MSSMTPMMLAIFSDDLLISAHRVDCLGNDFAGLLGIAVGLFNRDGGLLGTLGGGADDRR